ncbi:MAG: glycosyltransferase, partial [Verrucomicrobia bacterium]|nr:glycosyltransferase [Verrucomicrobiota bacterium]
QAIFITEHGKNYFLKLFPQYYNKYSISKLGVPERGDSKPSRDGIFRIVTCSNLLSVKRVDLLAKSLLLIDSIHIQWTHFGDGDNSSRASLLKISSGFSNNILFNFKGRVTNSEVMDYYKMNPVDLFCNVSLSEGLPVSIMEALSFGVPVYATDCGGVSELVNDENGKLLNLHLTPESLAIDFKKFYKHKYGDALIRENARKNWANNVNSNDNYRAFIGIINGL